MMNFPLNLAVGAAQPVYQVGNYVYYKSGSAGGADPSIKVKTDLGDEYILQPGQGFRLDNRVFGNLQITNAGGVNTIIGQVLIADGGFFDNRVTGSVEVIDGGKNRTLAASVFYGYGYSVPVANQYGYVQLYNPAASGKRVVLGQITYAANQAASVIGHLTIYSSGLASFWGNAKNKNIGAPDSSAQIRTQQSAGVLSTAYMADLYMPGALNQTLKFNEPIILTPGTGVMIDSPMGVGLSANFEFYEEVNA